MKEPNPARSPREHLPLPTGSSRPVFRILGMAGAMGLAGMTGVLPRAADAADEPNGSPAEIVSLKIIQNKDTAALAKSGDRWVVARDRYPVKSAPIEAALGDLGTLASKSRPYAMKKGHKSPSSAKEIRWTDADGKTSAIVVLEMLPASRFESDARRWRYDTSATGHVEQWVEGEDSTVWKNTGSPKTWLAEGAFGWVSTRLVDWKDRALLPDFYPEDIQAISVEWVDTTGATVRYRLVRDRITGVRMTEPRIVPLSNRNAALIFDRANQFAVDEFVPPTDQDSAAWGFSRPSMTVTITLWDGTTSRVVAGKAAGAYRYVRHPHHPRPVWVLDARLAPLRKSPETLLAPLTPNADAAEPVPGSEREHSHRH